MPCDMCWIRALSDGTQTAQFVEKASDDRVVAALGGGDCRRHYSTNGEAAYLVLVNESPDGGRRNRFVSELCGESVTGDAFIWNAHAEDGTEMALTADSIDELRTMLAKDQRMTVLPDGQVPLAPADA